VSSVRHGGAETSHVEHVDRPAVVEPLAGAAVVAVGDEHESAGDVDHRRSVGRRTVGHTSDGHGRPIAALDRHRQHLDDVPAVLAARLDVEVERGWRAGDRQHTRRERQCVVLDVVVRAVDETLRQFCIQINVTVGRLDSNKRQCVACGVSL